MKTAIVTGQQVRDGLVDDIIAYECGDLGEEETIQLFQKLIDTGLAWSLQGSYGRMAKALIIEGYCFVEGGVE